MFLAQTMTSVAAGAADAAGLASGAKAQIVLGVVAALLTIIGLAVGFVRAKADAAIARSKADAREAEAREARADAEIAEAKARKEKAIADAVIIGVETLPPAAKDEATERIKAQANRTGTFAALDEKIVGMGLSSRSRAAIPVPEALKENPAS